jgi:ATP-dependent Clp protease ATP-binding subunit ClpA
MTTSTTLGEVESDDPGEGLRGVVALRRLADHLERRHVAAARRAGWSWQEIGDALGVSRQAVHKKHRKQQMFERFTAPARSAVERAREEAALLGHLRIGMDHLVVAAAAQSEGELSAARGDGGPGPDGLRATIRALEDAALEAVDIVVAAMPPPVFAPKRLPFADGAKDALHDMIRLGAVGRGRYFGVEHLIVAIRSRSANDRAALLLRSAEVDPAQVVRQVKPLLRRTA